MSLVVSLASLAATAALWVRLGRERRAHGLALASLEERLRRLTMRVDVAEHDAEITSAHVEVAEAVLVDKGVADADDLEAARRRIDRESPGGPARARGGELN